MVRVDLSDVIPAFVLERAQMTVLTQIQLREHWETDRSKTCAVEVNRVKTFVWVIPISPGHRWSYLEGSRESRHQTRLDTRPTATSEVMSCSNNHRDTVAPSRHSIDREENESHPRPDENQMTIIDEWFAPSSLYLFLVIDYLLNAKINLVFSLPHDEFILASVASVICGWHHRLFGGRRGQWTATTTQFPSIGWIRCSLTDPWHVSR